MNADKTRIDFLQSAFIRVHLRLNSFAYVIVCIGGVPPISAAYRKSYSSRIDPSLKFGSPAWKLSQLSAVSEQPLLRGLDGERKFVAAHVLLAFRHKLPNPPFPPIDPDSTSAPETYGSMRFHLKISTPRLPPGQLAVVRFADNKLAPDPGQLPAIRDMWHDALDRTFVSIHIWWLIALGMIVPLLQYWRFRRRAYRLRAGQCLECGYDLRASTGVCPECGAAIVAKAQNCAAS